ncbi:MAG: ComF family protein [Bacteroidaceae bacterium]|nr:ComF family protein [Bacteroidaceae bacterium]
MRLFRSIVDFILPRYCKVCGKRLATGEEHLCLNCFALMPFMEWNPQTGFSPAERVLLSEKSVVRAASVIQYDKDSNYRKILYHLKYYSHPDVGTWLAGIGAERLAARGFFDGIDMIVPVPLSRRRLRHRGYNQSSYIAYGIRQVTGLPVYEDLLARGKGKARQAGLGRFQRWKNASGLYRVLQPERLTGKHVLLVDDVMTTGATLCSVINAMYEANHNVSISVMTLAIAT